MDLINISVGAALAYSVLGFAIVFFGLILLMIVIKIMEVIMHSGKKKEAAPAAAAPAVAPAANHRLPVRAQSGGSRTLPWQLARHLFIRPLPAFQALPTCSPET